MITKLYAVKDKLVGFGGALAFNEEKVAIRFFEQLCRQKKNQEYAEAKYFDLYEIGTFDTETGKITGTASGTPELIREGEQIE